MRFDRSHLVALCIGLGLGTMLHFVDWAKVKSSTESMATAGAAVTGLVSGIALALKTDPSKLAPVSQSFKVLKADEQQ